MHNQDDNASDHGSDVGSEPIFADPSDIMTCHPNTKELQTVQDSVDAGRPCVQVLMAHNHFVLSHKVPNEDFVRVYDSIGGDLSDHMKLQLSLVYGRGTRDVTVTFPIVQRQPFKSNLCGPLVCSFMADIIDDKSPEKVLYCTELERRQRLLGVLDTENSSVCAKKVLVADLTMLLPRYNQIFLSLR